MIRSDRSHLKIVWDKDTNSSLAQAYKEPSQLNLQLDHFENLIAFIGVSVLSGTHVNNLLRTLKPLYILDLRTCPRFDFSGYSRKRAFSDFDRWKTKYICLSTDESVGDASGRVHALIAKLQRDAKALTGPIVVFVETDEMVEEVSEAIPEPSTSSARWEVMVDGLFTADTSSG